VHHPEISVFLEFGLAAGHEIDELSLYGVSLNVSGQATAIPYHSEVRGCGA